MDLRSSLRQIKELFGFYYMTYIEFYTYLVRKPTFLLIHPLIAQSTGFCSSTYF
jgi:hypothetical protein